MREKSERTRDRVTQKRYIEGERRRGRKKKIERDLLTAEVDDTKSNFTGHCDVIEGENINIYLTRERERERERKGKKKR